MLRLRKICLLALLLVVLGAGTVLAAQPALRIAVLPVLDESGGYPDDDDLQALQKRLTDEVHIPLNATLQIAGYADPAESLSVLRRLEAEQRAETGKKRVDDKLLAPHLAEVLQADLVVYLRVKTYYQRIYYSYEDGPQVESWVDLRLCGYDGRAKRLIHDAAMRHEHDDYTPSTGVEALAQDAMDELLGRAQLRSAIFPLAGKN